MGLSAQVNELRATQASMRQEIGNVAQRFEARVASMQEKINSLGEEDPDLQPDVDALKQDIETLKSIGAASEPTEPPVEPPVEPAPVEPSPTEPGV
jgi:hypothetical protein